MKSGRRSFGAGIQASGHEPKNSQLRKLPNPRNRMLSMPAQDVAHGLVGHLIPQIGQCSHHPVVAPAGVLARPSQAPDPRSLDGCAAGPAGGAAWSRRIFRPPDPSTHLNILTTRGAIRCACILRSVEAPKAHRKSRPRPACTTARTESVLIRAWLPYDHFDHHPPIYIERHGQG